MAAATLVVRRVIHAPAARLFDAWTTPAELRRWWGPEGVECTAAEVDLRVGGSYRIANRLTDGRTIWIAGTFEVIDRPRRLTYSWTIDSTVATERVAVEFHPVPGGTEVIVTHEYIRSAEAREQHQRGWIGCLDGLARVVVGN